MSTGRGRGRCGTGRGGGRGAVGGPGVVGPESWARAPSQVDLAVAMQQQRHGAQEHDQVGGHRQDAAARHPGEAGVVD